MSLTDNDIGRLLIKKLNNVNGAKIQKKVKSEKRKMKNLLMHVKKYALCIMNYELFRIFAA